VVAEALFSADGQPPDEERLAWLEADFADFWSRAHGSAPLVLRASLFVLIWVAPLLSALPVPLSFLSIRRRAAVLERFEGSPLAPAALAVKAILCILWFEHERTRQETSTEPTCLGGRASGGIVVNGTETSRGDGGWS
jgi:hypothetical protein